MPEKLLSDLSGEEKTDIIKELIIKYMKYLIREPGIRKRIENNKLTLTEISELDLAKEPLPPECPYESYESWKKSIEKGMLASHKSLARMDEFKTKVEGLQFYIDSNPEVPKV